MGAQARFLQSDIERCIRAARKEGARLEIDPARGVITVIPDINTPSPVDLMRANRGNLSLGMLAPDGEENFG